jgi:hypothetical protein
MIYVYNDGGRKAAGYKGEADDCCARALAIATGNSYQAMYDKINAAAKGERNGSRKRGVSSARTGVYRQTMHKIMAELGWTWVPTMKIGSGCTVHLREAELPKGRLILNLSKHYCAFIDGLVHDTHDPSRGGTRCVYGYWHP